MSDAIFINVSMVIIAMSIPVLLRIYEKGNELLSITIDLDLYGEGEECRRRIREIAEHNRASEIIRHYYVESYKQIRTFTNGFVVSFFLILLPLIINSLEYVGIKNQMLLKAFRWGAIAITFAWLVYCILYFAKSVKMNKDMKIYS